MSASVSESPWQPESRRAARAELVQFTTAVVEHLPGWSVVEQSDDEALERVVAVRDADGRDVQFVKVWNEPKVTVQGGYRRHEAVRYPSNYDRAGDSPQIGVGIGRDPKAVARDIERRFVAAFVEKWDEHERRIAEADQRAADVSVAADRLAKTLGVTISDRARDAKNQEVEVRWYPSGQGYGQFRVSGSDHVSVELRGITVEEATRIAGILAERKGTVHG